MAERISDERAAELAALDKAATKAPWQLRPFLRIFYAARQSGTLQMDEPERDEHDAALLVVARNALPQLLLDRSDLKAEVQRLTEEREAVRDEITRICRDGSPFAGSALKKVLWLLGLVPEPPQKPL